MKTTTKETAEIMHRLSQLGIAPYDANQLRRISKILHRWFELECGDDNGCIERDEETEKAYWLSSRNGTRHPIADREKGALKRLKAIMAKYPDFIEYVQTDPRGASLYILNRSDVNGTPIDQIYNRGVAVY
jgi:hypothetical protein